MLAQCCKILTKTHTSVNFGRTPVFRRTRAVAIVISCSSVVKIIGISRAAILLQLQVKDGIDPGTIPR